MTSMRIPRIPGTSRIDHPAAVARRSPSARRFEVERLEARTALSSGLQAGPAVMDSYRAEGAPALIGSVEAAWTAKAAGDDIPATSPSAGAASAASGTGILDAGDIHLFAETYANLLPLSSELLAGVAGSIALVGQASRDGVPSSDLVRDVASAIGSTPAEIPPELIPLGVAEAFTAQEAGVALPATVAGLEGMPGESQIAGWVSAAVGQIEALSVGDGSTPPNQASIYGPPPKSSTFVSGKGEADVKAGAPSGDPGSPGADPNAPPAPPFLISLGKLLLNNINIIYNNYIKIFDNTSSSMASRPDGIVPSGLASVSDSTAAAVQEAQDIGSVGAGWISSVMVGGRSPGPPQGPDSQDGALQSPDSSPDEPVPPAAIAAGEIPLDVLLSDPELSAQGVSTGLEQIAELIPIEDSSLALIATLYSLPSESRSEPSDGGDRSGEREESVPSSASPPRWAAFVIGLDEAFARSGDACAKTLSEGARMEAGAEVDASGEPLEWRRPILPTPEGMPQQQRAEGSSLDAGHAAIDRAPPSGEPDPDPCDAGEQQPPIEGLMTAAWAVAGGALIAGWRRARRRFRQGCGRGSIGREDPGRGGRGHFEEGR